MSVKTTDLELETLGRAFSTALQGIPADDRSFSAPWNSTIASVGERDNLINVVNSLRGNVLQLYVQKQQLFKAAQ